MPRSHPADPVLHSSAEAAEAAFYDALQHGDLEAVMRVWAEDEDIVCIHPAGPRLVGVAAVRSSFEQLLEPGPLRIQAESVLRTVTLGCAVHSVVERVAAAAGEQFACVLATNVYLNTPQGWRMALHHASPCTLQEAAEMLALAERLH